VLQVTGGDDVSLRLLEMGLTPGVEVVLLGAAPLGDPLELEVRGYRLSVRKSEAARVEIEPLV
jgi:ferrous iron transport protein A